MTNVLTLTAPLMRRTVGFDRFNDIFDTFFDEKAQSQDQYPPHNIEKLGDDHYKIVIALAGFKESDLNIVVEDETLTVSGSMKERENQTRSEYLYQGIASRDFERQFRLADHIKVIDAELKDGLLTISLEREVPEEKKPRMIKIKGAKGRLGHGK